MLRSGTGGTGWTSRSERRPGVRPEHGVLSEAPTYDRHTSGQLRPCLLPGSHVFRHATSHPLFSPPRHSLVAAVALCVALAALLNGCGGPAASPVPSPTEILSSEPTDTPAPVPTHTPLPSPTPAPVIEPPARPLLMAHMMPWYQAPPVSDAWGWHWTMNHFQPTRQDADGRREIASYLYPLTGPYDSSDPAVLEYQVLLMHLSGIDGVIVDWYGIEDFWDYALLDAATHRIFEWIERAGLRFAICYEDQTVKHMVDNRHLRSSDVYSHGQEVMRALDTAWFGSDAYLTVDDRPVLFTFGPQYFKSASDWDQLFSVLDTRPALITLDRHSESAGLSSYPWPPMWMSRDGVLSSEALDGYLTGFYAKAEQWEYKVAGAFPGFHDIYQEAGVGTETRYLNPRDGETFRETLQLALDQHPHVIQLITWNDYGETTSIEPTEELGYTYLEMVQDARRVSDPDPFPFTFEDLRLPLRLYELRKAHAGDAAVNAALNAVWDAILAGDVDGARAVLDKVGRIGN
jgi:hypothetical protein